jgi:hypothetical protein
VTDTASLMVGISWPNLAPAGALYRILGRAIIAITRRQAE